MANESEPTGEEREFLDLLAESALNDYPNPDRIGCPGDEFLRRLATDRKSVSLRDPRLDHVVHCSPCFREFTAFQAKAAKRTGKHKTILFAFAAAAALVIAVTLWIPFIHGRGNSGTQGANSTPIVAQINLQDRSIVRGGSSGSGEKGTLHLPRGRLKLTVLLPFGSDAGTYQIQILQDVQRPLLTAVGTAEIVDGVTKLTVSLNTSSLNRGKYMLGVRQPPLDWTYSPIMVD